MESLIRLAVQKSGRLSERSLRFIEECGISYSRNKTRLKSPAYNFPLEILFLRDDDIPNYVAAGVADVGIVGENVLAEKKAEVSVLEKMGFSKCRLSLAIPQSQSYEGLTQFEGQKIATSYPNLLQDYLRGHGVSAEIHEISGSVEIAPGIGLADAVCDIVSSGSTLLANGLKEVEVIFKSQAVMIGHPHLTPEKQVILDALLFRIRAVRRAEAYKYVLMNVPNEQVDQVKAILPGMKSPTVTPLATSGWSSLHSVVQEDEFWEVIEKLKQAGAQGILVIPIEKMIM